MRTPPLFAMFALAVATCASSSEELPFDKVDVGSLVPKDRATDSSSEPLALGSTGYRAVLRVSHYVDDPRETPQFVTISVKKAWQKHDYVVCFERQFRASELPKWILTAKTRDIARYDKITRVVTLNCGFTSFYYTLPDK